VASHVQDKCQATTTLVTFAVSHVGHQSVSMYEIAASLEAAQAEVSAPLIESGTLFVPSVPDVIGPRPCARNLIANMPTNNLHSLDALLLSVRDTQSKRLTQEASRRTTREAHRDQIGRVSVRLEQLDFKENPMRNRLFDCLTIFA
jgi:hypothetical protein